MGRDALNAEPPRIRENQPAFCDGCAKVTNTVRGRCPECGYVKDDTWVPRARRERIIGDGPEDWIARVAAAGLVVAVARTLVALLS